MISRSTVAVILLLITAGATGQTSTEGLEKELKKSLEKNVVLVRHFYQGKKIKFEADGTATGAKEGIWTVDGYVKIRKIQIKNGAILIDGERLAAIYDPRQNNMRLRSYEEPVRFELPMGANPNAALLRMFVGADEDEATLVPDIWKEFAQTHAIADLSQGSFMPPRREQAQPEPGVYRVGGSVKPPAVVYQAEPEFSQFARQFRIAGTTTLSLIVDEKGQPTRISVIRPLGSGLDERAADAVMRWRFRPGTKNGVPVKTRIAVEVDFRFR